MNRDEIAQRGDALTAEYRRVLAELSTLYTLGRPEAANSEEERRRAVLVTRERLAAALRETSAGLLKLAGDLELPIYPIDRSGWICSVCYGWNDWRNRVCEHHHN